MLAVVTIMPARLTLILLHGAAVNVVTPANGLSSFPTLSGQGYESPLLADQAMNFVRTFKLKILISYPAFIINILERFFY